MKSKQKEKRANRMLSIGTWIAILAGWYLYTATIGSNSFMLPSPAEVMAAFGTIIKEGYNGISLSRHLIDSFRRLFIAVALAAVTAVPLGLLSGYLPKIRAVVDSIVQFYRPIPPLAYYALLIIWLGIEDESKISLLFLAAFAPIYIACVSAVSGINEDYILSAASLGASQKDIFFKIILPASLPDILTSLRTALGFAYTTLVAAEMTAATSGIGWMVIDASRYLKSDVMFVGIIIMGLTGVLMDSGLQYIETKVVYWKGKD